MAERLRLFAAVVLQGVLAARVDALRWALGSSELERIPPHLTLVPPTNVAAVALPALLSEIRSTVRGRAPFAVGLGPIATFDRAEPVLYVAVDDAAGAVASLAAALARGPFAPSPGVDRHPFVPHVTVVNRASPAVAEAATAALAAVRSSLEIDAVTLLQLDHSSPRSRWIPIAEYELGGPIVRGRGGLEIELYRSGVVEPEAERLLGGPPEPPPPGTVAWSVTARVGGALVGVACGHSGGLQRTVEALIVEPAHRSIGIGSRLLDLVEAPELESVVVRGWPIARAELLRGRGYREIPGGAGDLGRFRLERHARPPEPPVASIV